MSYKNKSEWLFIKDYNRYCQLPKILSVSKKCDIIMYNMPWFMNRLKNGYYKAFNTLSRKFYYISLKDLKFIVFQSKYPLNFFRYKKNIDKLGYNYYFHYTLNDYEGTLIEPNLLCLQNRIEVFKQLSDSIGIDRVLWRYDPIIWSYKFEVNEILDRIYNIGEQINGYTEQLGISFIKYDDDLKKHMLTSYAKSKGTLTIRENTREFKEKILKGIHEMNKSWGLNLTYCCEEDDTDLLDKYDFENPGCIDLKLIQRLCTSSLDDLNFIDYMKSKKNETDPKSVYSCRCGIHTDIGMYNICRANCDYCMNNYRSINKFGKMKEYENLVHDTNFSALMRR